MTPNLRGLLSTKQIADIFRVAPRTATRWIDAGLILGHRLPLVGKQLAGRRYVTREDALAFAVSQKFEWAVQILRGLKTVAFVSCPSGYTRQFVEALSPGWNVVVAKTPFEAFDSQAQLYVVGTEDGMASARQVIDYLDRRDTPPRVAFVVPDDLDPDARRSLIAKHAILLEPDRITEHTAVATRGVW